jgi:hypothetical protein
MEESIYKAHLIRPESFDLTKPTYKGHCTCVCSLKSKRPEAAQTWTDFRSLSYKPCFIHMTGSLYIIYIYRYCDWLFNAIARVGVAQHLTNG